MSGCVSAPLTDLKKPCVIMLFQTNKKEKNRNSCGVKNDNDGDSWDRNGGEY